VDAENLSGILSLHSRENCKILVCLSFSNQTHGKQCGLGFYFHKAPSSRQTLHTWPQRGLGAECHPVKRAIAVKQILTLGRTLFTVFFVTSTTALSLEFSHFKSKSREEIRNREHKYFVTLDNFASRLQLQQGQLNTMRGSLMS
jgi:hypothetical protein